MSVPLILVIPALLLVLIYAPSLNAQAENPYRAEVFGSLGVAQYVLRQSELNVGGGIGIRPFSVARPFALRMLGGEFEANFTRDHSSFSNPTAARRTYFTGNLVLHFPVGRLEPYLLVGAGASHQAKSNRAADAGVGAKIFITQHISLRHEIRGFITKYSEGDFVRLSVGLGYHW